MKAFFVFFAFVVWSSALRRAPVPVDQWEVLTMPFVPVKWIFVFVFFLRFLLEKQILMSYHELYFRVKCWVVSIPYLNKVSIYGDLSYYAKKKNLVKTNEVRESLISY